MKTFTCLSKLWREGIALVQTLAKHWQNPDKTPTKLQENLVRFAALFCLLVMAGVGSMQASQYVYDCSNNNNWVTASGGSTKVSYGTAFTTTCYYTDGTAWSGTGGANCSLSSSGYFFLGKSGATLVLPTYTNEKITSVVLHSSSGHSTSVSVNIYTTGGTAASSAITWSTKNKDYVYAINTSYQASTLRIQVTNAYNTQFTRITINTAPNSSCAGTQLATPEVTATPSSGQIQLSWPAVTNATKYQVSWNGGKFTDATSPFTKTSLTNSTSYTWAVKAIGNGSTYCDSEANEGSTKPSSTVYTITWKVYGESDKTTKVASGDHLMLPPSPSSCAVGTEFAGWSATNIGGTPTDTKPTFVSSQTTISANQTYYAVFATRTANSYTKGDINDLFPGQTVLIVNESNAKALSDEYVAGQSGKRLQKVDVSISSSKITSSNTHIIWTVENCGLKYNFKTSTGYLRATMTGNDQLACNKGTDPWTLTSAGSNKFYMNSNSSVTSRLEYYSTNSYFTTYGTNATGTAYEMSFFVPTYTQYFTSCASCTDDPTIGAASITNDPFVLTSLTGTVTVNCSGGSTGSDNCTWADRGYVWSLGTTTTTPTVSNNKVAGGNGDKATGWAGNITPSGSTTPTAWEVGKTYYIRAYGKNGKDGAAFAYGTAALFTLRSITFHSNGGTSVGPWYVNSGGTYEAPTAPTKDGFIFGGWYTDDGTFENPVNWSAAVSENKDYYARWFTYGDYVFSCAELTLTGPTEDLVFITSAANKTVRSQEAFHIEGSGLTPSTALTFTISDPSVTSKFAFKKADGSALSTESDGTIDTDFYVYYTPGAGDTSDGMDQFSSLTASVSGAKPKTVTLTTKTVIGRHLPANFVVAAKVDGRWYALPANKANGNPAPIAIRVDNNANPTTAYCVNTNSYTLYQDNTANSAKVILGMTNKKSGENSYALFGSSSDAKLGYSTGLVNGDLGDQYKWTLKQTATSISSIGDVKYTMRVTNRSYDVCIRTYNSALNWGTYTSGTRVSELRLLTLTTRSAPAMSVMEWGTDVVVLSYSKGGTAKNVQAIIGDGSPTAITLTGLGGDIYKTSTISGLSSNPGKTLTILTTESSTVKEKMLVIPFIVGNGVSKTEQQLREMMPGADATARNAAATLVDVVIRSGGTLTTTTNSGSFANLYVYPGGKAILSNNFKIKTKVYLRGGYSFLDEKATYQYPDLCIKSGTLTLPTVTATATAPPAALFYDLYIDNRYYYTFSMPDTVRLAYVHDETGSDAFNVWVKHYNGATRASGQHVSGWEWYGDGAADTLFRAGVGYEITAQPRVSGRTIAIIRFPVKNGNITSASEAASAPAISVGNYGKTEYDVGSLAANNVGWNFLGNPYLTEYKAVSDTSMIVAYDYQQHKENGVWDGTYEWKTSAGRFITVPRDVGTDYHHEYVKGYTIPAFSAFFFQTETAGTFTMGGTRPQAAAPTRYSVAPVQMPELHIDVMLRGDDEAVEGKAGLIIHDKYEGGLKDFEDVEQWFVEKNELKTYTFADGAALAYNLTNEETVVQPIPMGYIATVAGEHTYSLNEANDVSSLEHLWLTDYEDGITTDLLVRDYTFITEAGRFDGRFALSAVFKQQDVVTDISDIGNDEWTQIVGVYHDGKTLTLRGLPDNSAVYIYDMTGKLMASSDKLHNIASFNVPTQGVYNIRVVNGDKAVTLRSVIVK